MNEIPERIGPYGVEGRLGAGGMGVVMRARHRALGRVVALKVRFRRQGHEERLLAERFRQGAMLQAELDHPNIARVFDYIEAPTIQAMAMEYLGGGSLEEHIRERRGPLDIADAVQMAICAADALDYAHTRGVIHRDIKPGNLILDDPADPCSIRITDFGVAKTVDRSPDLTVAGANVGTIWYMPPEQFNNESPAPRVDVYALGASLYEMITGSIPFDSANHAEIFRRFLDREPVPPVRERNPQVSVGLAAVVERSLEIDPDQRVASASALGGLLRIIAEADGLLPVAPWVRHAQIGLGDRHLFDEEIRAHIDRGVSLVELRAGVQLDAEASSLEADFATGIYQRVSTATNQTTELHRAAIHRAEIHPRPPVETDASITYSEDLIAFAMDEDDDKTMIMEFIPAGDRGEDK